MRIPGRADWEGFERGHDEGCAFDHFFGKSLSEAEDLFADNALIYEEDLLWMPKTPFQFYLLAFMNYLKGERSKGDSDGASSFISLISHKLGHESEFLTEVWPEIESTMNHVAGGQEWYDARKEIYGDFGRRVEKNYKKARKPGKQVVVHSPPSAPRSGR